MHDATSEFVAPEPGNWQNCTAIPEEVDCIGHNDLGPYNVIYHGADVAAIRSSAVIPRFDWQRDEKHADGYREDIQYILRHRDSLLHHRPGTVA